MELLKSLSIKNNFHYHKDRTQKVETIKLTTSEEVSAQNISRYIKGRHKQSLKLFFELYKKILFKYTFWMLKILYYLLRWSAFNKTRENKLGNFFHVSWGFGRFLRNNFFISVEPFTPHLLLVGTFKIKNYQRHFSSDCG